MNFIAGFTALSAEYLDGTERRKSRAYAPAAITEGGRIAWLAGQLALADAKAAALPAILRAKSERSFRQFDLTLKCAGGRLSDMVTVTVFINDPRNGDRFVEMRRNYFSDAAW